MKLRQIIAILGITLTVGATSPLVTPSQTAQAKPKTILKTFPKSIRGAWYIHNALGYYHAVRLVKKGIGWQMDIATKISRPTKLMPHKLPFSGNRKSKNLWVFAIKKQGFVKIGYWNNTVTIPPEGYYRLIHKKYQGKKIRVLQETNSLKGRRLYLYYYPTKKIAKHFTSKD